jgi:hypothetical protein
MNSITQSSKRDIVNRLSEFWLPHLMSCEDLFTHLKYVDTSMKEIRSEALRKELESFDTLLSKEVPKGWRFKEYRRRTIITLAGKITYLRRIYVEPSGICHALLDEVLGIRTRFQLAPDAFLWIATMGADVSFRKTAKAFYERTGAKISHWLVMSVIHEEGRLILEEAYELAFGKKDEKGNGMLVSQDLVFVEFDGISIPLQKTTHEQKRPRLEYEKNRKKRSFEMKVAVAYAGKDEKGRRGGVVHFCADEPASCFWPLLNAKIGSVYNTADIEHLYTSSDAAGWCKNNGVELGVRNEDRSHHLDRFHLNREIRRAFGKTKAASHFINLAYERRTKRLKRDLQLVINRAKDKDRYLALQSYILSNIDLIKAGAGPSMGTMEGTNAHVYGARLKAWATSWSRHGAYSIAAIRAYIASGVPLIAPKVNNALLDDPQISRRQKYEEGLLEYNVHVPQKEGKGWESPQGSIVLTTRMAPHLYGVLNYS